MSALQIVPLEYTGFLKTANPHYKTFAHLNGIGNGDTQEMHLQRGNVFCRVQSNSGRVLKCPRCHGRHHAGRAGGQADAGAGAVQRGHPRVGALLKHLEKYAGLSGAVIRLLKSY